MQALATLEGITHQLKQAGEIQTPSIVAIGARVVRILNKLTKYQYLILCVFFITGLDNTIANNILTRLTAGRQYLKTDFKIHTASTSPCADQCRVFALSRTEAEYKGECQHQHTITCDRCEGLKNAVADLQLAVDSSELHLK